MSVILNIKNAIVCIPTKACDSVLASKGEINFIFNRYKMENLLNKITNKEEKKLNNESEDLENSYMYSLSIQDFEIFLCDLKNLISQKFNEVIKRKVVLPHSFFIICKNFINLSKSTPNNLSFQSKNEFNLEKTSIHLSYNNFFLINEVIKFQKDELLKSEEIFKKEEKIMEDKYEKEKKISKSICSEKKYSIVFHGVQIVILLFIFCFKFIFFLYLVYY